MKERPILFSGPMVRAILEGRKTQTRRVIKPQPYFTCCQKQPTKAVQELADAAMKKMHSPEDCSYGVAGDRLWVRESFIHVPATYCYEASASIPVEAAHTIYRADDMCGGEGTMWKPSIFMPRWASRLTLEISDVRVQRLQEISEQDALAEGIPHGNCEASHRTNARRFCALWDEINAKRGFGWGKNPWVWAITFRRLA